MAFGLWPIIPWAPSSPCSLQKSYLIPLVSVRFLPAPILWLQFHPGRGRLLEFLIPLVLLLQKLFCQHGRLRIPRPHHFILPVSQCVKWRFYTWRNKQKKKIRSSHPPPPPTHRAECHSKKNGTPQPPALMEWHRGSAQEERKTPREMKTFPHKCLCTVRT